MFTEFTEARLIGFLFNHLVPFKMKSIAAKNRGEVIYEHTGLSVLVAISQENNCTVKAFQKKHPKNKKSTEKISGFKLVVDQEFGTLKIDFSESFDFLIKDLKLFPLK